MAEVKPREFLYVADSHRISVGKGGKATTRFCGSLSQVVKLTNGRERKVSRFVLRNQSRIPLYFLNGGLGVGV